MPHAERRAATRTVKVTRALRDRFRAAVRARGLRMAGVIRALVAAHGEGRVPLQLRDPSDRVQLYVDDETYAYLRTMADGGPYSMTQLLEGLLGSWMSGDVLPRQEDADV